MNETTTFVLSFHVLCVVFFLHLLHLRSRHWKVKLWGVDAGEGVRYRVRGSTRLFLINVLNLLNLYNISLQNPIFWLVVWHLFLDKKVLLLILKNRNIKTSKILEKTITKLNLCNVFLHSNFFSFSTNGLLLSTAKRDKLLIIKTMTELVAHYKTHYDKTANNLEQDHRAVFKSVVTLNLI